MNYCKHDNPTCNLHKDCFANLDGEYSCLNNTDFQGKDCPFYKTEREPSVKKKMSKVGDGAFCFP